MNTKFLLLLGAAVGLLFLAALALSPTVGEPECTTQLVDSGHFVLELNGIPILEEAYTLEFDSAAGYLLNSQGAIVANGETVTLGQQTQYDERFRPMTYTMAIEMPDEAVFASAQMGEKDLEMVVQTGLSVENTKVTDIENVALLDNNLIGQFAVLLLAIRSETLDRSFTAAIPQALLSLPARVDGPNSVTFYSGGKEFQGKQFDLHLGDTEITLIEYEGHLAGLANRSQGTMGYDTNIFPSGITVDVQTEVEATDSAVERDVTFESGDLTLEGTLRLPDTGEASYPAILFIHGSGPVDRDGNAVDLETGTVVMQMDIYRQLAEALSDVGFASFRFDKRGVGNSQGDAALASRGDLIDDARAAIQTLRNQPEIDATRLILVGHSEGGYLAPMLAVDDPDIAGVVLLASAARSLDEITRWQVESLLTQQGVEGVTMEAALAQQDQYIAFVKASSGEWADYTVAQLQEEMAWLDEATAAQLKSTPLALSWLREHYLATPADTMVQLNDPVLIISGEKDIQVPSSEAQALIDLLTTAGNSDVSAFVFPDLNHLLRYHPEEPNLTVRHLNEPVDPRVIVTLQEWLEAHFGD